MRLYRFQSDMSPARAMAAKIGGFVLVSGCAALVVGDWIAGLATLLLILAWACLPKNDVPPILALAFAYQWTQVCCGIFYSGLTGRQLAAFEIDTTRQMVILGLGCVTFLFGGALVGDRLVGKWWLPSPRSTPDYAIPAMALVAAYVVATALEGSVVLLAGSVVGLLQPIRALMLVRLGIVFLLLRRTTRPMRWLPFGTLLLFEITIGFTGYFASFREAEVLGLVALLESWRRFHARQRLAIGGFAVAILATGVLWTAVKGQIRAGWDTDEAFATSQTKRVESLAYILSDTIFEPEQMVSNIDLMVGRQWAVMYPAMALKRVPSIIPFEHGAILKAALVHIATPRLFFPDKPEPKSDSEMVRNYSGVHVAGSESNTSIAFGYAIESYIDFGVPLMFVPVLLFGFIMGCAHRCALRLFHHKEIAIASCCVITWMCLFPYERSWLRLLGIAGTVLLYVGGASLILDRLLGAVRVELQPFVRPLTYKARREPQE
jgi:hypothetical protein